MKLQICGASLNRFFMLSFLNFVCIANEPTRNGTGHRWIANQLKPVFQWNLGYNNRWADTLAIFNDFQQISAFFKPFTIASLFVIAFALFYHLGISCF